MMEFICWYSCPSLRNAPCWINSKIGSVLRSSVNSFFPTLHFDVFGKHIIAQPLQTFFGQEIGFCDLIDFQYN